MRIRFQWSCFIATVAVLGLAAQPALATVQDFSGPAAGTVIAGALPQGGSAPGTFFPDFSLSVTNTGGGPHSLIVFDSNNPTGEDPDLGSPNQTCPGGGPGIGVGGQVGAAGENCVALNNLLIVAEDIVDVDLNDVVDDPDDEAGGGVIKFTFDAVVVIQNVTIIDIDGETADFTLENDGTLKGTIGGSSLGDNSVQTLDLSSFGDVTCLELDFSSSGAVAEIEYTVSATPVDKVTWGTLKKSGKDLLVP